jgi:hypothetical protein
MKVTVSHTFNCTPDTFWKRIFFDRAYNEAMFLDEMKFPAYELAEFKESPDRIERKVRVTPPQKAPEIIRKLIKGTLSYEELGTWTAQDGLYRFRTITSMMTEKINITGVVRAEPAGADKMVRRAEMEVSVNVMLVGGTVEKFLAAELQSNYDVAAGFTNRWITEHSL